MSQPKVPLWLIMDEFGNAPEKSINELKESWNRIDDYIAKHNTPKPKPTDNAIICMSQLKETNYEYSN